MSGYPRVIVLVVALAALAVGGPAVAANPPPADDTGLVDQYREDVPTAGGPSTPGGGGGNYTTTPLPGNVRGSLYQRGGKDAKTLEKIATSSRYGAPRTTAHGLEAGTGSPNVLSAAVSAVSDGSDARLIGLFVALLVVAAMMFGAAAAKRGRRPGY